MRLGFHGYLVAQRHQSALIDCMEWENAVACLRSWIFPAAARVFESIYHYNHAANRAAAASSTRRHFSSRSHAASPISARKLV